MTTATQQQYEARMYGFGYSVHSSLARAKRGLARMRREYRDAQHSLPYPQQTISHLGRVIYCK